MLEQPEVPGAELGGSRRDIVIWDWLGLSAAATAGSIGAAALAWRMNRIRPGYPGLLQLLLWITLALWIITVSVVAAGSLRWEVRLRDIPRRVLDSWASPARTWMVFSLGAAISLPLAALHTRVILGDSDSARLLASLVYVQRHGPHYLVDTQANILPHLVLGPVVRVWGIPGGKALGIALLIVLAGLVCVMAWRLSGATIAGVAAVLALLSCRAILERAVYLPMYPAMLVLGFGGVYLAYRSVTSSSRWRLGLALLAGLSLVASSEAHGLGFAFLVTPALLPIALPFRQTLRRLVPVAGATTLFYLPRVALNLAEGGLRDFLSYRDEYWITKGYLVEIQRQFWGLPSTKVGVMRYPLLWLHKTPRLFGWTALLVLGLACVAFLLARGRLRWLAVAGLAIYMGPAIVRQAPLYPRYFSPLAVGAALAAGAALPLMRDRISRGTWLIAPVLAALFAMSVIALGTMGRLAAVRERQIVSGPYLALAEIVNDGKGVIGARTAQLLFADSHIETYGTQFLEEREFVTYLTWPSDQAVISMMKARNIGWAYVNPLLRRENRYNNTWLRPLGLRARHVKALEASPNFCLVFSEGGYKLYRLGGCR
ncbi:MAG TPA: hypothetical protein VGL18_06715 [Actinomycetota bacterium]